MNDRPSRPRMKISFLIIHVILIVALGELLSTFTEAYMMIAFGIYAFGTITLKKIVPKDLRKGMELVKAGQLRDAVTAFKSSYDFFTQKAWIDKYRVITMLSVSPMSYREMSLINIGFCYSQLEEVEKSRKIYEKILKEYPQNDIAKYALKQLPNIEE
ncbi:MAG: hypothetical protein JXR88_04670 [Clostridia bacterium]|nr:hypothetical protein [Clostridia bacterium]